MEYQDTVERSTELLRKALPLMSRQAAGLHPVSYAVWYAYVAEPGSALHQAVDAHLAQHGTLDEAATEALYRRHLAPESDDAAVQRVTDGMQLLLEGMSASAAAAGDQTARYGHTLERLSAELGPGGAGAAPRPAALQEVLEHTLQMQQAMVRLQQRLVFEMHVLDGGPRAFVRVVEFLERFVIVLRGKKLLALNAEGLRDQ